MEGIASADTRFPTIWLPGLTSWGSSVTCWISSHFLSPPPPQFPQVTLTFEQMFIIFEPAFWCLVAGSITVYLVHHTPRNWKNILHFSGCVVAPCKNNVYQTCQGVSVQKCNGNKWYLHSWIRTCHLFWGQAVWFVCQPASNHFRMFLLSILWVSSEFWASYFVLPVGLTNYYLLVYLFLLLLPSFSSQPCRSSSFFIECKLHEEGTFLCA